MGRRRRLGPEQRAEEGRAVDRVERAERSEARQSEDKGAADEPSLWVVGHTRKVGQALRVAKRVREDRTHDEARPQKEVR